MAQAFARFGSAVTLIESAAGLLPREDRDAAAILRTALERDGVNILCDGKDLTVSRHAEGIRWHLASGGAEKSGVADQLLVAVGRTPNVENLGLESAGVTFSPKGVAVNERLQTRNPAIFACGDVCSRDQFTHAADFMARLVIQNALFLGRRRVTALTIPWATYTSPEVAHVGLTTTAAAAQGVAIDTFTQPLAKVDRAILDGEDEGFVRVHVRRGTDQIVGATVVAAHAGDLIGELSLAMTNKIGLGGIGASIHPYPTQAEAIRKVGDLYSRTRLTPFVQRLLARWLAWQRS
jgi:pyruvate/2-oxoglutarate dehydrogenase complex dihydrolipoamide dehydrogenase (E3) component